jgi:hypothetical protein
MDDRVSRLWLDYFSAGVSVMNVDQNEAARFLACLDPEAASFTFQTFDDNKERAAAYAKAHPERKGKGDPKYTRVLHGSLEQCAADLARFNDIGSGVFVTVNQTDLKARKADNIVKVRAVFVDLDGSPLDPVMANGRQPHIVTETSPGRWHAFWRIADLPNDQFKPVQEALAAKFKGDKKVSDLPRVMRLPGFWHKKAEPKLVQIKTTSDHEPFLAADFPQTKPVDDNAIPDLIRNAKGSGRGLADPHAPATLEDIKRALKHIPAEDYGIWFEIGAALRSEFGESARATFHEWSRTSKKYDEKLCEAEWVKVAPYNKYTSGTIFHYADELAPGWRDKKPEPKADEPKTDSGAGFPVTPYVPRDTKLIPPRQWLYHPYYVKQYASVTVGQSGVSKSLFQIAEALAMVSGKPLLNIKPQGKLRVWYWNGEDPPDELERRFAAAMKHYGLTAEDIGDRLFFSSGDEIPMVIVNGTRFGAVVAEPVVEKVTATIIENQLDVLWIDPFVSCHTVGENDNSGIDTVAKQWGGIAKQTNCSIMLVHHSRKIAAGGVVTADDARGASALNAAGRMTRTINKMSEREADDAEIDGQQRWRYVRVDVGKNNNAPPSEVATWVQLVSVDLDNAKEGDDWFNGDSVGVCAPWTFPQAEKRQHSTVDILRVQEVIRKGGPWREDQRSTAEPWVGKPIAEALGYDLARRPEKKAVVALIKGWLTAKLLKAVEHKDQRSVTHVYVEAGETPG